jgi:anti-sigma B factor antagonist
MMASLSDFKPIYFRIEERGALVIAHIAKASLSEEDNIEHLGQELTMLVDQYGCRLLVVNFEVVTLITSAALGKFISLHRNLHRREGQLAICGVTDMMADVLLATRLNEYFKLTATVDDAVTLISSAPLSDTSQTAG